MTEVREYPLDVRIGGDVRWTIVERLCGGPDRGVYLARAEDGSIVRVTTTTPQRLAYLELGHQLALDVDGVAKLRWIGPLRDGGELENDVLVEDAPPGRTIASLPRPVSIEAVASIAGGFTRTLCEAHRLRRVLGGIRPETIFCSADDRAPPFTGVAPRGETFFMTAKTPSYGVPYCWDRLYAAPEVLSGRPAEAASDVFAWCATIAHLTANEHPFVGDVAAEQMVAIVTGRRRRYRGPRELAAILDRGLAADAKLRPQPDEILDALRQAAKRGRFGVR